MTTTTADDRAAAEALNDARACEDDARACDEQADRWEAELPAYREAARAAEYGSHRHQIAEQDLSQKINGIQHYRAEAVRLRAQARATD